MRLDVTVGGEVELSMRARQVCGMFDCPPQKKQELRWQAELPLEERAWSVGLIVGPSGSGKSTAARSLWPEAFAWSPEWGGATLVDDFDQGVPLERVVGALSAVGFNTVPAWLRPFAVLSNGEQFRASIARRLCEQPGVIVVDEFTSVVDRQVARVASHAVQRAVRAEGRQLVAVTCHRDVEEWLQPDWVFEPAERRFTWRQLRRRPALQCEVARVPYEAWATFAPYHYLTNELHPHARCFGLWCEGVLASFSATLHFPHPKRRDIVRCSRVVTLPDYQGIGLSHVLNVRLGAAFKTMGKELRFYPAHPSYVRQFLARPETFEMVQRPGRFGSMPGVSTLGQTKRGGVVRRGQQQRPCATFRYVGPIMDSEDEAERLLRGDYK